MNYQSEEEYNAAMGAQAAAEAEHYAYAAEAEHHQKMEQYSELTPRSIVALFQTTKEERQSFALSLISEIESGNLDPLKVHLQVKCMEDIIKLLNSNTIYKSAVLEAAEKYGQKSFDYQNSKVEIKETGVKYDYSKCNDPEWELLEQQCLSFSEGLKQREAFLKTVPGKGLEILNGITGELVTIYPPAKSSTTSIAITLK